MKRTIKLSLCLLSALLTLLSCQEESIQADYQIIPLPQQIQLKSNEDPFIINILQMQTPALHPTDTVTTIHGPMKGFGNHITKL